MLNDDIMFTLQKIMAQKLKICNTKHWFLPKKNCHIGILHEIHEVCMWHSLTHSFMADRRMVVGHVPMDHTCSFMCTSHIDMTAHNPAFL